MRLLPGIVGGFLVALWLYVLVAIAFSPPSINVLILVVAGVVSGYFFARSAEQAWSRVWLVLSLLSFALPLAAVLFTVGVGTNAVNHAANDAGRAGAAVGSFIGGAVVTAVAALIGFFLGIIFALLAYFTRRTPPLVVQEHDTL